MASGPIAFLRRLGAARSGIASLEFVFVLPLLTLMLFGTVEIGRLLFDYHAASKSIRDATRYLTRIDTATLGLTCGGVAGAGPVTEARNLALTGTIDGSGDYFLAYWTDPNSVQVTASCVDNTGGTYEGFYSGLSQIPRITVTGTVSFPLMNGWLLGRDNDLTFTISHEEAHFGE